MKNRHLSQFSIIWICITTMGTIIVHIQGMMNARERMIRWNLLSILIICAWSCSRAGSSAFDVEDLRQEVVCSLSDAVVFGRPNSIAVLDDSSFVVCDNSKVYRFDFSGNFLCQIGASGRSAGEYLQPLCVRAFEGSVYVWSSWIPKIIEYTPDGVAVAEYAYSSGVTAHEEDPSPIVLESDTFLVSDEEIDKSKFWHHYCSNSAVSCPDMSLVSSYKGKFYALDHAIENDEDVYKLVQIDL